MSSASDSTAYGMLAAAAFCWAGNHIAGRWMAADVPPVPPGGLSVARWLLAFAVLAPFAWKYCERDLPQLRAHATSILLLGLAGGATFGVIQYYALRYTGAVNVGVMNSVGPAFIILAGALIFRDRVGWRQIAGIFVSLLGVLVIITRGSPGQITHLQFNAGDLLALLNMAIFAIYSACLRTLPKIHVLTFIAAICLVSALGSLPVALIETLAGLPFYPTRTAIVSVLYTGLFTSLVGYLCWSAGVARLGVQRSGVFLHLVPVFGAVLSVAVLGEAPRAFHAVGLFLIVVGVTMAARRALPS